VFFGSAINNFGVEELLAPSSSTRRRRCRARRAARRSRRTRPKLTGFVFKIQANMDPSHRDRIAFLRVCSGKYSAACAAPRAARARRCASPMRSPSWPPTASAPRRPIAGDIIGLHNHGTINIGDTFTEGEKLNFTGIPNFAPELFRRAVLRIR
jgi:peptide chain release factor 3